MSFLFKNSQTNGVHVCDELWVAIMNYSKNEFYYEIRNKAEKCHRQWHSFF